MRPTGHIRQRSAGSFEIRYIQLLGNGGSRRRQFAEPAGMLNAS
jgi:hypothetical protein